MEDLNVIDLVFLHGYDNPTVGVICKVFICTNYYVLNHKKNKTKIK
jgi:hypothetical protein